MKYILLPIFHRQLIFIARFKKSKNGSETNRLPKDQIVRGKKKKKKENRHTNRQPVPTGKRTCQSDCLSSNRKQNGVLLSGCLCK